MKIQYKRTNLALTIASVIALSGCIEVEDSSNDELTAALQQQNQILSNQLAQSQQTNTVTISGLIVDALTERPLSGATITVKTASSTIVENKAAEAGLFSVEGLPANSALEIIVSSPDTDYMTRVFYTNTGDSTSGVAEKDFGKFKVSMGQEVSITVSDSETNMPITGLEFIANSNSGSGATADSYKHFSSFDEVNGVYIITLPVDLNINALASIDANRDGERDFEVEDSNFVSGTNLIVRSSRLDDLSPIMVKNVSEIVLDEVQFRLSIIDASAQTITEAMVSVNDNNNDLSVAIDSESNQYLVNAIVDNSIQLQIPAFSAGGVNYQSANITVYESSDTQYRVSVSNDTNNNYYFVDKNAMIDLVLQPRITTQSDSPLQVLLVSDPELIENHSLSVFYSQPVTVLNSSVSLNNLDAITVVKGNDSDTDIVLPGTTTVVGGKEVAVTLAATLNDTKITVTPASPLLANTRYEYNVASVTIKTNELDVDLYNEDDVAFVSSNLVSDELFDINDIKLDNNNYTNNGVTIVAQNTAGVNNDSFNSRRSVLMFLPNEVNQLKTLTLNQTSYIADNQTYLRFVSIQLIIDGQLNRIQKSFTVSAAENENVQQANVYGSVYSGTVIPDGIQYSYYNSLEYLSDNTSSNANSITFDYAYETKAGEITTGSISLPIN